MKVLILGGSKSGKSDFSQEIALKLADGGKRYYVAPLMPVDKEDDAIVESHLERRAGMGFETVEQGTHLLQCLEQVDRKGTFMVDSVTTLLANELYPVEKNYELDEAAADRCVKDLLQFSDEVEHVIFVVDNLFFDAVHYSYEMDTFRRYLGTICCKLAAVCDLVLEMSFGNLMIHKGEMP